MRNKGIGRGKVLTKPKKTAADFAREAELERRKSVELAAEDAAVVEAGRFSSKACCILRESIIYMEIFTYYHIMSVRSPDPGVIIMFTSILWLYMFKFMPTPG